MFHHFRSELGLIQTSNVSCAKCNVRMKSNKRFCSNALRWSNTSNKLLRCKLKSVGCTYYHQPQTLSRNKISLLQVEAACCSKLNWRLLFSTNIFNLQQQSCCVRVWGGWMVLRATTLFNITCNATILHCKLMENVARITGHLDSPHEKFDVWTRPNI